MIYSSESLGDEEGERVCVCEREREIERQAPTVRERGRDT
jgi:hypothetical protein